MQKKGSHYLIFLIVAYLIGELTFNYIVVSHLGNEQKSFWEGIGRTGKLLSGFAISLFIFKLISQNDYYFKKLLFLMIFVMPVVYFSEDRFISYLVNNSSPQMRQRAVYLSFLPKSLKEKDFIIENLSFDPNHGEGKVVIGITPSILLFSDNLYSKYQAVIPKIIAQYTYTKLGGEEGVYKNIYQPLQDNIYTLYKTKYYATQLDADKSTEVAWNNYVNQLSSSKINYNSYTEKQRKMVVNHFKIFDPTFPDDFQLYDKPRFKQIALKQFSYGVTNRDQKQLLLAPRMTFIDFTQNPIIQKVILDQLKDKGITLQHVSFNLSKEEFLQNFYAPIYQQNQNNFLSIIKDNSAIYANGGSLENTGKDLYEILILPFVALGFSLIGIMLNLANLTNVLLFNFLSKKVIQPAQFLINFLIFPLFFFSPYLLQNTLVDNAFFKDMIDFAKSYNLLYGYLIEWIAHLQPLVFEIMKFICLG